MLIDKDGCQIDIAAQELATEIVRFLRSETFRKGSEAEVQDQLAAKLSEAGYDIKGHGGLGQHTAYGDFLCGMIDDVGIACKVKGQKMAMTRQCERTAGYDDVHALIVLTPIALNLPKSIAGKPVYWINLARTLK